jgi:hypothetical protein
MSSQPKKANLAELRAEKKRREKDLKLACQMEKDLVGDMGHFQSKVFSLEIQHAQMNRLLGKVDVRSTA